MESLELGETRGIPVVVVAAKELGKDVMFAYARARAHHASMNTQREEQSGQDVGILMHAVRRADRRRRFSKQKITPFCSSGLRLGCRRGRSVSGNC